MKEFTSLNDAFNYQVRCPICNELLRMHKDNNYYMVYNKLIYDYFDDKVSIDLDTNEISLIYINYDYHNSITYVQIERYCDCCYLYDYLIRLKLDFINLKAESALNAETITIEVDGVTHQIHNSYSNKETRYVSFYGNTKSHILDVDKEIKFPLMTIDLKCPKNTLDKIKTLIPFI
jgi:hypothetical protein